MRPIIWLPKFWRVCKSLLDANEQTLVDWLGSETAMQAEEEIKKAPTIRLVKSKLKIHEDKFQKLYPTEESKAKIRSEFLFDLGTFLPFLNEIRADSFSTTLCPACACQGGVAGESWNEEITNANDPDEPWLELVETTYITSAFRCSVCGLRLNGRDELEVAGVLEQFVSHDVREPDYEPEYGNE